MPTYQSKRRGISISEALAAAAAIAPVSRAMLFCFELRHPSLAEPFRFVDDRAPFTATLESTAPVDASQAVVFLPLPLMAQRGEESDTNGSPESAFALGNVSGLLGQALRAGRGSLVPWEVTERLYASDDTAAPARMPVANYIMTDADIAALQAVVRAGYGDPINVSVPKLTFKREEYSGLP